MKTKTAGFLGSLALAGIIAGSVWPGTRDPKFEGIRLSKHLRAAFSGPEAFNSLEEAQRSMAARARATRALAVSGTNALPLLDEWLRRPARYYPAWLENQLHRCGRVGERLLSDSRLIALKALNQDSSFLHRHGAPLIPALAHCLTNSGTQSGSAAALNSLLPFVTLASGEWDLIRRNAAANISDYTSASPRTDADPWDVSSSPSADLIYLAESSEYRAYRRIGTGEPESRLAAAMFLAGRRERPETVIPTLALWMGSNEGQRLFGPAIEAYGVSATSALPKLELMLTNRGNVRIGASNAIRIIRAKVKQE